MMTDPHDTYTGSTKTPTTVESLIVSYTVKELLHSMQESLVKIDTKLDSKASLEALHLVEKKVDSNDLRISNLEMSRAKAIGAMAFVSFMAGGGGYVLATFANAA